MSRFCHTVAVQMLRDPFAGKSYAEVKCNEDVCEKPERYDSWEAFWEIPWHWSRLHYTPNQSKKCEER